MRSIALIVPKGSRYGENIYLKEFLKKNDTVYNFYGMWETPNLSLLTIAGIIPGDWSIDFIDEDHGQMIHFDCNFDIVAITGMTQQIQRAYEISDEFRKRGVYVAIGGIHATIMPDEAKRHADTVFIGEGEETWKQFIDDFEQGVPAAMYESGGYIDLTQSPIPRYDLVDKSLYSAYSIQTTRGCPRTCSYCTLPIMYGSTYRHKSVEQILKEIRAIQNVDKEAFIFFVDDNMFIDRKFSKKLLIEVSRLGIKWGTQTDISVAEDEELMKLIYKAGCHWLFIGFENVTEGGLKFLDKKQWKAKQLSNYEEAISRIHQNGLNIWASFMFGGDSDDVTVFNNTLQFVIRNNIYSGSFTIVTPLPGTKLYKQMVSQNRILDYSWSRYTFWDVVFQPKNMSADQLARGVAWVYSNFYSAENVAKRTLAMRKRIKENRKNEM